MGAYMRFYTIRKTDGSDEEFSHFKRRTKEPVFVVASVKSKCYLSVDDAERDLGHILEIEPALPLEIGAWDRV